MSEESIQETPQERQVREERLPFVTQIVLELDHDRVIHGTTADVSMSGAFLKTEASTIGVNPGEEGVATVTVEREGNEYTMAFPCTVMRVTDVGIGLDFDEMEGDEEEEEM